MGIKSNGFNIDKSVIQGRYKTPLNVTGYPATQVDGYADLGSNPTNDVLAIQEHQTSKIDVGQNFFVIGVQDLSVNQVLDFTWLMPNTAKWIHWVWSISAETETAWYIYEGATATNALTNTVTPLNSNRNSTTTSGTIMKYEVQANLTAADADTDVTAATLLESGIAGSGKMSGEADRSRKLILKQNTLYCMRAIASSAGYVNFDMNWFEHVNKNT